MSTMTTPTTATFTVQPFAAVPVDGDAGGLIDAVLSALEQDGRALAPVVAYDYDTRRVDAIFQVTATGTVLHHLDAAAIRARHIFDDALVAAGLEQRTAGIAIVEGDDPELLP